MPGGTKDEFEARLHATMRRVEAPDGFRGRVMERVQAQRRKKVVTMRVWSLAIAAMLLMAVGLGITLERRHTQREEEARVAQQQFEVAMQVTARSMSNVQRAIDRATNTELEVGQ